jgi:hypothetical protein
VKAWWLMAVLGMIAGGLLPGHSAFADSLRITPLHYNATLVKGESKKGFVDIANPSGSAVKLKLTVQAFRQIDDEGNLEFFDDEQVSKGVMLDYTEAELGPRETLHLAFSIDSSKLPSGEVFAAIFASTQPQQVEGAQSSVRVGTLLSIVNGASTDRKATIASLAASPFQIGDALTASFVVKNMADPRQSTGYYPQIVVNVWPYTTKTIEGPLVFAGRARSVDYRQQGDYLGVIKLTAHAETGEKSTYFFAITGYWRWLLPITATVAVGAGGVLVRRLRRQRATAR